MTAGHPPAARRRRAAALLLALTAAASATLWAGRQAGPFLAREDPLQPADAIVIMAGSQAVRPLEGADLYHEGFAPLIVVTRDLADREVQLAAARGVRLPTRHDLTRALLAQLGVPDDALVTPDRLHDSTADEAATLRRLAVAHGWRRVIVVSSKYHLRRVALAGRRELRGTGVELVVRGSRYDDSTPAQWWRRRADIRWVVSEAAKLTAYALHIQP